MRRVLALLLLDCRNNQPDSASHVHKHNELDSPKGVPTTGTMLCFSVSHSLKSLSVTQGSLLGDFLKSSLPEFLIDTELVVMDEVLLQGSASLLWSSSIKWKILTRPHCVAQPGSARTVHLIESGRARYWYCSIDIQPNVFELSRSGDGESKLWKFR